MHKHPKSLTKYLVKGFSIKKSVPNYDKDHLLNVGMSEIKNQLLVLPSMCRYLSYIEIYEAQ
jgi:hypothetical protein